MNMLKHMVCNVESIYMCVVMCWDLPSSDGSTCCTEYGFLRNISFTNLEVKQDVAKKKKNKQPITFRVVKKT